MSKAVFVDTSAWYALADAGDVHHVEAAGLLRRLTSERRRLVTTNGIVGETYTLLLRSPFHRAWFHPDDIAALKVH